MIDFNFPYRKYAFVFLVTLLALPGYSQVTTLQSSILSEFANRQSAPIMAQGKVASTNTTSLAALAFNPALLYEMEGFEYENNVNTVNNQFIFYQNFFALPTVYGNFMVSTSFWDFYQNPFKFDTLYDINFTYSFTVKEIFHLGVGFVSDPFRQALSLGITIPFYSNIAINDYFGFWELSYGGSIRNIPINSDPDIDKALIEPRILHGLQYMIFKSSFLKVKQNFEFEFSSNFVNHYFRTGMSAYFFDIFYLAGGYYGNDILTLQRPTFGGGLQFKMAHTNFTVSYARDIVSDQQSNEAFSLNLTFQLFGQVSSVIQTKVTNFVISPKNNDGVQDISIFELNQLQEIRVNQWKLWIFNVDGDPIKTIDSNSKQYQKDSVHIPKQINWNGRDNLNNLAPDGNYKIKLSYETQGDAEKFFYNLSTIQIDNTPPKARIVASSTELRISPEVDAPNFKISFEDYDNAADDIWSVKIKDNLGNTIRHWTLYGDEFESTISWDLRDDYGKRVHTGRYILSIKGFDAARNSTSTIEFPVQVIFLEYFVSLSVAEAAFSPNEDGILDTVDFDILLKYTSGISRWDFKIVDASNNLVFQAAGERDIPQQINWDGKSNRGVVLPQGIYFANFAIRYLDGRVSKALQQEVHLDVTPPDLNVDFYPKAKFSPDGDGLNELVNFDIKVRDQTQIVKWEIDIYEPGLPVFKTFQGNDEIPPLIRWDGTSNRGILVKSLTNYFYRVKVRDKAGNSKEVIGGPIEVDFLILKLGDTLRIQTFGILFAFGRAEVYKDLYERLNIIGGLMNARLREFNLQIEGHTDEIGDEEQNLTLGKKRAESVAAYLIKNFKIDPKRITVVSKGSTEPVISEGSVEELVINRRVEFIFTKKDDSKSSLDDRSIEEGKKGDVP